MPTALAINHVIDLVYISGWRALLYGDYLRQAEITHVVKLCGEVPRMFPPDFTVLDHPTTDGQLIPAEHLQTGVRFVQEHANANRRVLVMCRQGASRSATFVLAYLLEQGYSLHDAFVLLRGQRQVNPHPDLWQSLITHYNLDDTWEDIKGWYDETRLPLP